MFRRRSRDTAGPPAAPPAAPQRDPFDEWLSGLDPRWRPPVDEAVASRRRFHDVLAQVQPGPTRERLESLTPTIDEAVHRVATAVTRAAGAAAVAATLDVEASTAALKVARRDLEVIRSSGAEADAAEARVQAMTERHLAVNEAINLAEDAGTRLGELNIRLDTAVARAATLALRSAQDQGFDALGRDLDDVLAGLAALDDALDDLNR